MILLNSFIECSLGFVLFFEIFAVSVLSLPSLFLCAMPWARGPGENAFKQSFS